jgi:hypothetical protein
MLQRFVDSAAIAAEIARVRSLSGGADGSLGCLLVLFGGDAGAASGSDRRGRIRVWRGRCNDGGTDETNKWCGADSDKQSWGIDRQGRAFGLTWAVEPPLRPNHVYPFGQRCKSIDASSLWWVPRIESN